MQTKRQQKSKSPKKDITKPTKKIKKKKTQKSNA